MKCKDVNFPFNEKQVLRFHVSRNKMLQKQIVLAAVLQQPKKLRAKWQTVNR